MLLQLDYIRSRLISTATWRAQLAAKYPDKRNAIASDILRALADGKDEDVTADIKAEFSRLYGPALVQATRDFVPRGAVSIHAAILQDVATLTSSRGVGSPAAETDDDHPDLRPLFARRWRDERPQPEPRRVSPYVQAGIKSLTTVITPSRSGRAPKSLGTMLYGKWRPTGDWTRYCDRLPTEIRTQTLGALARCRRLCRARSPVEGRSISIRMTRN